MKQSPVKNLVLSALLLALGLVLPFLTGQIPQIGSMLLPLHLPVLICGLICGWKCGLTIGFILPLMRSFLFGMPALFPSTISMAFEMATYGALAGWPYDRSKWQCVVALYRSLLTAMISGRIVWGAAQVALLGLSGSAFTWKLFFAGAFLNALPGIILQLIFIPTFMVTLDRTGMVRFKHTQQNVLETVCK